MKTHFFGFWVLFSILQQSCTIGAAENITTDEGTTQSSHERLIEKPTSQKLRDCIQVGDFDTLGKIIRASIGSTISFQEIKQIAFTENCVPLQKAVLATESIVSLREQLGLTVAELVQISLFIETEFQKQYKKNINYSAVTATGLSRAVEYDPKTGYRFIHLGAQNIPRLGKGSKKLVTKSILYDTAAPEIVARCQQSVDFGHERQVMGWLKDREGVLQAKAFTEHQENNIRYYTIFCKLYQPGAISKVMNKQRSYRFTLHEKIKIALDIMKGLHALKQKEIIHRDLGAGNYLIHISKKNGQKRNIEVVIGDLGSAKHVSQVRGKPTQGHSAYTAPEGIAYSKLMGKDYFGTDLFAAGSLLYRIFYETAPRWVDARLIKNRKSVRMRQRTHVALIQKHTRKRRMQLMKKIAKLSQLNPKEEFESVILKMVDPDPLKRGTPNEIKQILERLFNRTS